MDTASGGVERLEPRVLLSGTLMDVAPVQLDVEHEPWAIGVGVGLLGAYYDDPEFTQLKLKRTDAQVDFDWGDGSPDPALAADGFSVRWTGQIQALTSEAYTFDLLADDSARLWVGGQLLLDTRVDHAVGGAGSSGGPRIELHAGQKYDIRLEYHETWGEAAAQLLWSTPTIAPTLIPRSQLYNGGDSRTLLPAADQQPLSAAAIGSGTGLLGNYYDNGRFTDLKLTRTDAQVNFHWGEAAPDIALGGDTFSVRWTGQVQAVSNEVYTFHTYSDDGVRLWVDDQLLIDNWTDHVATLDSGDIALEAGRRYEIRLDYYEAWGGSVAQLHWSTPTMNRVAVPSTQLYSPEERTPTPPAAPQTPEITAEPPAVPIPGYDTRFGFGLVDAAAALGAGLDITLGPVSEDGYDWAANMVNAPEVWAAGFTGEGVVVAVIDSGVDYTHVDLGDNIWTNPGEVAWNGLDDDANGFIDDIHGWDFIDRDPRPMDLHGHGTHVAGTIAAERNEFGVTGIAYDALIMPVRVLDVRGSGSLSNVALGIRYAVDNGADVINLSLGSRTDSQALRDAIVYAESLGVIIVSAAGNSGSRTPVYPAAYAGQFGLAVGAVDDLMHMPGFSSRAGLNPLSYVVAPGVSIFSTKPGGDYGHDSGTSMATPHVAAIAAILRQALPDATPGELKSLLTSSANHDIVTV